MVLFRKPKQQESKELSEPPAPADSNPLRQLVAEMDVANNLDLEKHTTLDARVRELEAVYKSNRVLGKKILKLLEDLRSTMDNLKEHEHIAQLQKQVDKLSADAKKVATQLDAHASNADAAHRDLRQALDALASRNDLKKLQERTKQGFKEAEERFASVKRVKQVDLRLVDQNNRLDALEEALAEIDVLRAALDTQKQEQRRLLELVELLSKKLVI